MRAAVGRPGIRGRDDELAALARFLDEIPGGAPGLVIEGEAGIGKTTLWREGRRDAEARGYLVLSYGAVEAEVSLPFVGLGDLLEPVLEDALPMLPPLQREALDAALLHMSGGEGLGEAAVSAGALGVLRGVEGPVVVAIDDIHWLDRHTARVLAFVLRRLEGAAAILASRRLSEPWSSPELERVLGERDVDRLPIGPLSLFALDSLLREQVGVELERAQLRELHRVTGGNPLFAREIARDALRTGSTELTLPRSLSDLLRRRVRAASPGARRLLLLALELGDPRLAVLEQLDVPADAFGELAARDLALPSSGRLRLAHPLLGAAAREETTEAELRELHRFLAERLEDEVERALHLALATIGPDEHVAAVLDQAASIAEARGAQEAAVTLADDAVRFTAESGELRWRRLLHAAYHLWRIGDLPRMRQRLEEVLREVPPGPLRARALCELALVDEFHGNEHARSAREQPGLDQATRCQIDLLLGWQESVAGQLAGSLDLFKRAERSAVAAGDDWQRAIARASTAFLAYLLGRRIKPDALDWSVAAYDRYRAGRERRSYIWEPRTLRGRIALIDGRPALARGDFERLLADQTEIGDELGMLNAGCDLVRVEVGAGDLDAAQRHLGQALEVAQHVEESSTLADCWATAALVYAWIGRPEAAREAAARAMAIPTVVPEIGRWARSALGVLELSLGNADAADAELSQAVELARASRFQHPGFFWFWHDALEACVLTERLDRPEALLKWLDELTAPLDHAPSRASAELGRALLCAAQGDLDGAIAGSEAALGQHERFDRPLHLARTLLIRGGILRRAKKRGAARESLTSSASIFEGCGAPLWAERARRELERTGIHHVREWELTPTEAQVAGLAAGGAKNKEIAEQLFMSVKTVEANLSRVYGKLGIRSRTELAAKLK